MNFRGDGEHLWRLFEFEKNESGYQLKRYLRKDDPNMTAIEIPPKFRSLSVRGIGSNAFEDAVYLKSAAIPETVVTVGYNVFKGCRALSDISLPNSLKIVNGNMFDGCCSLERLTVPEGVEVIRPGAFSECEMLEEVVLPESGCILYSGSFFGCQCLRSIVFPEKDKVTLLGSVFENCPLLPAETRMYALIGLNDLDKPFIYNYGFDWSTALREDVFALAVRHNSFANIGTDALFRRIIDDGLTSLLPLAAGILDVGLAEALVDYSSQRGKTEITAWLLNFINPPDSSPIERIINERFDL